MRFVAGVITGAAVALAVVAGVGYLAVMQGWIPAAADGPELPGEAWAARHALHAVLSREAQMKSPLPVDEKLLNTGATIYAGNCSGCHGTPKTPNPNFAKGYDPPPTFFGAGDLVTDDPEGWTYWKTKHGIKFTGMPSFKPSLSDNDIWAVTMFLKNMDKLPPAVNERWKNMQ
jgi:mono/diheme cytochrome c family protein